VQRAEHDRNRRQGQHHPTERGDLRLGSIHQPGTKANV
jgi:hypothetical protein